MPTPPPKHTARMTYALLRKSWRRRRRSAQEPSGILGLPQQGLSDPLPSSAFSLHRITMPDHRALDPTALTSFSPSRNFSEVEWAAPAEGGLGGTLSQRQAVARRQARPAGMI